MSMFRIICSLLICLSGLMVSVGCRKSVYVEEERPALTSINIIDRNGFSETTSSADRLKQYENTDFLKNQPYQKVLRIYGRDAQGAIRAYITSYHPNGHPRQYLEVVNNRAYGTYKEWYSNGILKLETFVIGGDADVNTAAEHSWLFDGCSTAWDEDGKILAEILYSQGALEGVSTYYHPNGVVWKRIPFHQGQIQGVSEVYLETGELLQTTEYQNGQKNGVSKRYWDNGKVAADEIYCQGMLTTGLYYDKCGKQIESVKDGTGYRALFSREAVGEIHEYRRGVIEGEIKVFDESGILVRLYHLKNGVKHGLEIEYYDPNGGAGLLLPKMSITWAEGAIQGLVKTWYPSGTQESQREMNNNEKNGLLTAWYRDGSLMLIEEYEHDKLMKGEYYIRGEKLPVSQVKNGKGTVTLFDGEGNVIRKILYANSKPVT